ncbi:MAG: FadR family transcriptional regulator [Gemmatimonadetes bacterium]|jgi:DNA-binding FadR family transcriptional regulator|nr:FadR family transcriptional regulator [Gemmatimonadota bacterium]MBP9105319.1 FadR family transcriptional regulator [Gemmatimonadaceae bacterium]MBK8061241.1 FadR family transcriptional regulator [Gemmatimonadota bacterium]MBK8647249.1 FadR family transcriptional regulator [Gemmatimonadota bacterium]MBK9409218.1 FadR family transcriptional regulator [Gemmatimonadota bacterium]
MSVPFDPIRPKERLFQEIVEHVQAQILSGELKPGDRIPAERELATHFGVSRAAVREAIKSLAEKGLVEVHVGRGTFVATLTTDHVVESMSLLLRDARNTPEHLQEAREILEVPIARLAAQHRTAEHIERLRAHMRTMEAQQHLTRAFIDADGDFHYELARATGNPVLEIVSRTLLTMLRSERVFMVGFRDEIGGAIRSHAEIVAAVERQDAEAAGTAMATHLGHVSAVLRSLRGPAPVAVATSAQA